MVLVSNAITGEVSQKFPAVEEERQYDFCTLSISEDNRLIVTLETNGIVRLWNTIGHLKWTYPLTKISLCAQSPLAKLSGTSDSVPSYIVACARDKHVFFYDLQPQHSVEVSVSSVQPHKGNVEHICFISVTEGADPMDIAVSGCSGGRIVVWDYFNNILESRILSVVDLFEPILSLKTFSAHSQIAALTRSGLYLLGYHVTGSRNPCYAHDVSLDKDSDASYFVPGNWTKLCWYA